MEIQVWPPEPLTRKKPSERKPREEEKKKKKKKKEEEPDISELLDLFQDIGARGSNYDVNFSQSTYRMGGGG